MKSKKKLLIAMAAMSVAAIGAGTVSTFAWYTANAASTQADVVDGSISTLATDETTTQLETIYLRVEMASSDEIALSTSDGYTYGLVGDRPVEGKLTEGKYDEKLYGTASLSVHAYRNAGCTDEIEDGDPELEGLTTSGTATVTITAGTRTKVAAYNSTYDTDAYKKTKGMNSISFGATTTATLTVTAAQDTIAEAFSLDKTKVFYRIFGEATDVAHGSVGTSGYTPDDSFQGALSSSIGTIAE